MAPAGAVAAVQERSVAPAAAVAAIWERPVAPTAAVAAIQARSAAPAGAVAAVRERPVALAAAVAAIQERYRGLEAGVAASGSVARPVTVARDAAEVTSAAAAAIGDVARSQPSETSGRRQARNIIINKNNQSSVHQGASFVFNDSVGFDCLPSKIDYVVISVLDPVTGPS